MSWRSSLGWFGLGLAAALLGAWLQPVPGYMDAEYYYAQGTQLARGKGPYEPFLWNYLDDPPGIPHPAFAYWMPLPALLAAAGMRLSGSTDFFSARLGFILLAGLLAPLAVHLATRLMPRRQDGWLAGGLAVFTGFYAVYLTNTESFTVYMLLGTLFLLAAFPSGLYQENTVSFMGACVWIGGLAGLMHLTRADGILWLPTALVVRLCQAMKTTMGGRRRAFLGLVAVLMVMLGYGAVMVPWYLRNLSEWGRLFPPGGWRTLWLTRYDQLFVYPADRLNLTNWLAAGWTQHWHARLDALWMNLKNAVAVQGAVFLTPLILMGLWRLRNEAHIRLAGIQWVAVLAVMTLVFPFAGSRGGFLHSGAAFQPLFWAVIPAGLDAFVALGVRYRNWQAGQAKQFFGLSILVLMLFLTVGLFWLRVYGSHPGKIAWLESYTTYREVEQKLIVWGARPEEVVMVNNPPGYFIASGRPAIVIPDGDETMALAVARRYAARYLILEQNHVLGLHGLYNAPGDRPSLEYLGGVDTVHIFKFMANP